MPPIRSRMDSSVGQPFFASNVSQASQSGKREYRAKYANPQMAWSIPRLQLEEERRPNLAPEAPVGGRRPEVDLVQAVLGQSGTGTSRDR